MNRNIVDCAALLTVYSVLGNAERIVNNDPEFTNLHNALYNVIVELSKNIKHDDIFIIKKAIRDIERVLLPNGKVVTENMLLNQVDQILEDIKFNIPKGKNMSKDKKYAIDLLQELIRKDEQFSVIVYEELEMAEKYNSIIYEILRNSKKSKVRLSCYK